MGCQGSKQVSSAGKHHPEELAKCTEVSAEVRWSWLRGRTLFTFAELRELLKLFRAAAAAEPATGPFQEHRRLGRSPPAPICGVDIRGSSSAVSPWMVVDKAQFLSLCETNDAFFRLSEVVGAFGSRLFDVLDDDGDGLLAFETFAVGLSKLLKGPEREKLKLMYAAYDLTGVAPSEERKKSSPYTSGSRRALSDSGYGGRSYGGSGAKASKPPRRSKYLTVEDITEVLASASQAAAYPTLLSFTADGGGGVGIITISGGDASGCSCGNPGGIERAEEQGSESQRDGQVDLSPSQDSSSCSSSCGSGIGNGPAVAAAGSRINSARTSRDPEALAELLQEIARRNAAAYAERAVSEFGSQAQGGKAGRAGLTQKEFERWALTGPVLRCRINEFSIDLNLAPFQGVQLS